MSIELWIAEGANGSVQFDSQPSRSDILNACADLEAPIRVYFVEAVEVSRSLEFIITESGEK